METFDPPIFASLCSENLNIALQRLSQFKQLVGPLNLMVEITAHQTNITLDCYGNDEPIPHSLGAAELVFLTQLARLGTRTRMVPIRVELVEPPDRAGTVSGILRCLALPRLGQPSGLFRRGCEHPFLTENAAMWRFFEAGLAEETVRS